MAEIVIRDVRPDEAPAILDLWRRARATPTQTDCEDCIRRLLSMGPNAFLLVAEQDGRLAGSVLGTFDGWRGNIYRLAVDAAMQRRGLARALMEEAARRLMALGAERITALVEKDHPDAMGFWSASPHYRLAEQMVRFVRSR